MGGGGLNEGGDLMFLTPKCDILLEIPCIAEAIQHLPEAEWVMCGVQVGYE